MHAPKKIKSGAGSNDCVWSVGYSYLKSYYDFIYDGECPCVWASDRRCAKEWQKAFVDKFAFVGIVPNRILCRLHNQSRSHFFI